MAKNKQMRPAMFTTSDARANFYIQYPNYSVQYAAAADNNIDVIWTESFWSKRCKYHKMRLDRAGAGIVFMGYI